jgi:hypothetical protein
LTEVDVGYFGDRDDHPAPVFKHTHGFLV